MKLTDQELQSYIEGQLDAAGVHRVESVLRKSAGDFRRYLALKETLYLGRIGKQPDDAEREKIMKILPMERPHLQILLSFLKDRVVMSSSDNESLGYQGLQADFSFRDSEAGPISITRTIEGRELKFVLTPEDEHLVRLSVLIEPPEKLSVSLVIRDEEVESITDLSRNPDFSSFLPRNGEVELKFRRKGEVIFTVGFTLRSE